MDGFTPSRLDLARRRRGFTKKQLAEKLGVSPRSLLAYERGDKIPSPATLARAVAHLGFPAEFFAEPDIDEPAIAGVSFRSKSSMSRKQRDQAVGSASIAMLLTEWIDERFDLPKPDVPRLRDIDPESAANEVRHAWGVGNRPISNTIHLLEAHGVRVYSLIEDCEEVDAFSFWKDGVPYVFLNSMKSAEHRRMDAAHELGHLVLHFWGGPEGRYAEEEAKSFAAAFLMPRDSVLAYAPQHATVQTIVRAKHRWGVSAMALAVRLQRLGLLTEWQARSTFIAMSQAGYRKREPEPAAHESSQVFATIFAELRKEGITKRALARDLNVPLDELNAIVFGLTITAITGDGVGVDGAPPALTLHVSR